MVRLSSRKSSGMGIYQYTAPKVSFNSCHFFGVSIDLYYFFLWLIIALIGGCLVPSVKLNWSLFAWIKPPLQILSVTKLVLHQTCSEWTHKFTVGSYSNLNLLENWWGGGGFLIFNFSDRQGCVTTTSVGPYGDSQQEPLSSSYATMLSSSSMRAEDGTSSKYKGLIGWRISFRFSNSFALFCRILCWRAHQSPVQVSLSRRSVWVSHSPPNSGGRVHSSSLWS